MDAQDVIKYPTMTERSVYMIENENKLIFIVDRRANKNDIAKAVKTLYNVEVEGINTLINRKGEKKPSLSLRRTTKHLR
jgi:large subunit ribosomal protein L23